MKTIFTFLLMFACMVSFTAGATTTKLEQKEKTELVKAFSVETSAVSVANDYQVVFIALNATIRESFERIKPVTFKETIVDVGWRNSNYNLYFKSDLLQKNRIHKFSNKEIVRIRTNC